MSNSVVVMQSGDSFQISIARSMLEAAGIPCSVRNEDIQNLFGVGQLGTGFCVPIGPLELSVPEEFSEEADELLEDYRGQAEKGSKIEIAPRTRLVARVIVFSFLFVFMIGQAGFLAALVLVLIPCSLFTLFQFLTLPLKRFLNDQGYDSIGSTDVAWIFLTTGRKAYKIPPASAVLTLPEYSCDAESIIRFVREFGAHKKAARNA